MLRPLIVLSALLIAIPVSAQADDGVRRIVVAEVENEAIRPLLSPPQVAGLVTPEFDRAKRRLQKRPQFEQSVIRRGPEFRLEVDAQFADGNDFLVSLPLEEVEYGEKTLLVLVRRDR